MEKKRTGRFEYKWEESRHQGTRYQDFAIDLEGAMSTGTHEHTRK